MATDSDDKLIPMLVKGLMLDPVTEAPIVVLRDEEESRFLPIWIGASEANAIAITLENVQVPRPMTHDLLVTTLQATGITLNRIEIHSLVSSTFYARLILEIDSEEQAIDARPSDAIAVSLRVGAPILVSESVLKQAKTGPTPEPGNQDQPEDEKIKEILKNLDEEDLGDYTM